MPKKIKKKYSYSRPQAERIRMSEVIAEFAEPLLREAVDGRSMEVAVLMAVTCWNLALLPEKDREEMIREVVSKTAETEQHKKDAEGIARMLIARKEMLFQHIRRFVVGHDVRFADDKMILNIASTEIN